VTGQGLFKKRREEIIIELVNRRVADTTPHRHTPHPSLYPTEKKR
jgi:hypothetical protein